MGKDVARRVRRNPKGCARRVRGLAATGDAEAMRLGALFCQVAREWSARVFPHGRYPSEVVRKWSQAVRGVGSSPQTFCSAVCLSSLSSCVIQTDMISIHNIRNAYRTHDLLVHPAKNQGDPSMSQRFALAQAVRAWLLDARCRPQFFEAAVRRRAKPRRSQAAARGVGYRATRAEAAARAAAPH